MESNKEVYACPRISGRRSRIDLINLGLCTGIVVTMTATVAFCSSIYTAAIDVIADHYKCSRIVSTLGVTTFLLGFATGPLLFAPLSEIWSVVEDSLLG